MKIRQVKCVFLLKRTKYENGRFWASRAGHDEAVRTRAFENSDELSPRSGRRVGDRGVSGPRPLRRLPGRVLPPRPALQLQRPRARARAARLGLCRHGARVCASPPLRDTVALQLGPAPRQRDLLAPDRHICRDSSSKAGHAVAFQVEVSLGGATGTQCDVRPGNPSTTRACGLKHLRMGSAGPGGAASHGLRPSVRPAAPALRRTLSPACY